MSELAYQSFIDTAAAIRRGELSPVEYLEALLARIERYDGTYHAFITLDAERAMAQARAAESAVARKQPLGPLHGVPFALKDIIDAEGLLTTCHSKLMADNVATADAPVTARLKAAGGILVGKLSTHEFAIGGPSFDLPWPPARNPWDPKIIPGGSSSGSGAALAAGFVPIALGSDTAGSVRNPATMCGIVGIKQTYGLVSRRGVVPLSFSLDHVGPMTRTVAENAALLGVIAGPDPEDPASARPPGEDRDAEHYLGMLGDGIKGLRIGVIRHFYEDDMKADEQVVGGIERALVVFKDLGAEIRDVTTRPLSVFSACNRTILLSEAFAVHQHWLENRPEDYGAIMRARVTPGAFIRAVDYVQALRLRRELTAEVNHLLEDVDVLMTASSMDPPFVMDDSEVVERCYPRQARTAFNVTGHPAISVPAGYTANPLPLGFQLIGRHFDEATVYRFAHAYEQSCRWYERHPDLIEAS